MGWEEGLQGQSPGPACPGGGPQSLQGRLPHDSKCWGIRAHCALMLTSQASLRLFPEEGQPLWPACPGPSLPAGSSGYTGPPLLPPTPPRLLFSPGWEAWAWPSLKLALPLAWSAPGPSPAQRDPCPAGSQLMLCLSGRGGSVEAARGSDRRGPLQGTGLGLRVLGTVGGWSRGARGLAYR